MTETLELSGGRRASYEVVGEGRPALMFPGGPGFAAAYMRGDAQLLGDTLRSYLIDPHGSGASTPPAEPSAYGPEGHAAFYEEVRAALGLERVVVLGHSFGATTALCYAALFPQAAEACVAIAPFGIGPDTGADEAEAAAAAFERGLARHAGSAWYPEARALMDGWSERMLASDDPEEATRMMETVLPLYTAYPERAAVAAGLTALGSQLSADLAAMKAWEGGLYQTIDLRPLLARIACPTLVLSGELDFICGPAQAWPIANAIADVRLELVPDCGHFPSIESPEAYRRSVLTFLSESAPPPAP